MCLFDQITDFFFLKLLSGTMGAKDDDVDPPFSPSISLVQNRTFTVQFVMNFKSGQNWTTNLLKVFRKLTVGFPQNLPWLFMILGELIAPFLMTHRNHTQECPCCAIHRSKCQSRSPWNFLSSCVLQGINRFNNPIAPPVASPSQ